MLKFIFAQDLSRYIKKNTISNCFLRRGILTQCDLYVSFIFLILILNHLYVSVTITQVQFSRNGNRSTAILARSERRESRSDRLWKVWHSHTGGLSTASKNSNLNGQGQKVWRDRSFRHRGGSYVLQAWWHPQLCD